VRLYVLTAAFMKTKIALMLIVLRVTSHR